jgi:hypothetical protein
MQMYHYYTASKGTLMQYGKITNILFSSVYRHARIGTVYNSLIINSIAIFLDGTYPVTE